MSTFDANLAVCNVLGIDPDDVVSIHIEFTAGNPPEVTIVRHILDDEQLGEIIQTLERRNLWQEDQ